MTTQPTNLLDAKKRRDKQRYNALVLAEYDHQEHVVKREQRERKAESEREARRRF